MRSKRTVPPPLTLYQERHADGFHGGAEYPPGPQGLRYECHECKAVYHGRSGVMRHESATAHTVLRQDWYHPQYWEHVKRLSA